MISLGMLVPYLNSKRSVVIDSLAEIYALMDRFSLRSVQSVRSLWMLLHFWGRWHR